MTTNDICTETGNNYVFIAKFVPYDKQHGFYEYTVEGKYNEVQNRIQKEYRCYNPCGYGTHFECVYMDGDKVIYKGNRMDSCD